MTISLTLVLGGLILALLATGLLASKIGSRLGQWWMVAMGWFFILGCYLVCVGAAATMMVCVFHTSEMLAIGIGAPLGIPVLYFAIKLA